MAANDKTMCDDEPETVLENKFALASGIVLICFYSILFVLSGTLLIRRHGCPRQGWAFLNVFCHQRLITGAVMIIMKYGKSTAKDAIVVIMIPQGFLSLIFAAIQVLRIAIMNKYPDGPIAPKVRWFVVCNWLIYLLGQDFIYVTSAFGHQYQVHAFLVIMVILLVILLGGLMYMSYCVLHNWLKLDNQRQPSAQSQMISCRVVAALLPISAFMIGCSVVMAIAFLSRTAERITFSNPSDFLCQRRVRYLLGSILICEIVIVIVFIILGFSLPRYLDMVEEVKEPNGIVRYVVNLRPMGEARGSSSWFNNNDCDSEVGEINQSRGDILQSDASRSRCEVIQERSEPDSGQPSQAEVVLDEKVPDKPATADSEPVARQDWASDSSQQTPRDAPLQETPRLETAIREDLPQERQQQQEHEDSSGTNSNEGSKNSMPLPPPFVT